MSGPILVVNPGSSSLKLTVLGAGGQVLHDEATAPDHVGPDGHNRLRALLGAWGGLVGVGVRVVHGGADLVEPVLVDAKVEGQLAVLADLAPLHDPAALAAIHLVRQARPTMPVVACFDTAFFAGLPADAATFALPWAWVERWGLRRYGFHGLSHAYAARRAAEMLGHPPMLRLVTCHLGAGASLAAVVDGQPVDTTMGFTPLDGLVMATRPGTVDPGLVLWLARHSGLSAAEIEDAFTRHSGLAGLSGTDGDMRSVLDAAGRGDERACLALDVYLHRLRSAMGAMAAAMDGVDAVVFTGGVGEHAPVVRERACAGLAHLGVHLDPAANNAADGGDRDVAIPDASCRVLVVAAREDIEVASETRRCLAAIGR